MSETDVEDRSPTTEVHVRLRKASNTHAQAQTQAGWAQGEKNKK